MAAHHGVPNLHKLVHTFVDISRGLHQTPVGQEEVVTHCVPLHTSPRSHRARLGRPAHTAQSRPHDDGLVITDDVGGDLDLRRRLDLVRNHVVQRRRHRMEVSRLLHQLFHALLVQDGVVVADL